MSAISTPTEARKLAGLELNALMAGEAIPAETIDRAQLRSNVTSVYDSNGDLLFYRIPILRGRTDIGFVDVAANDALRAHLLSISLGVEWNEGSIIADATAAARRSLRRLQFDSVRVVAYSYPKIAIQFLHQGREQLMLEWMTWQPVPPAPARPARGAKEPSHFERWSFLDRLSKNLKQSNSRALAKRLRSLQAIAKSADAKGLNLNRVTQENLKLFEKRLARTSTQEIHYTKRSASTDHHPCFELRGQETYVWCVAGSVQMVLDFYRYEYTQAQIAKALGLGTLGNPNGLPVAQVGNIPIELENLTSNALKAALVANPDWQFFSQQIAANRPVISIVPGHCRTVIGTTTTTQVATETLSFRGLLVYDPYPVDTGVITKWENFDIKTYQYGIQADVTLTNP